jgi:hypothetical protein
MAGAKKVPARKAKALKATHGAAVTNITSACFQPTPEELARDRERERIQTRIQCVDYAYRVVGDMSVDKRKAETIIAEAAKLEAWIVGGEAPK